MESATADVPAIAASFIPFAAALTPIAGVIFNTRRGLVIVLVTVLRTSER